MEHIESASTPRAMSAKSSNFALWIVFAALLLFSAGLLIAGLTVFLPTGGPPLAGIRTFAPPSDGYDPLRVVSPMPTISEFPIKPVAEANQKLNPTELVLGVTVGEESRAYPINMLTGPDREILNDTLGGKEIAATW